MKYHSSRDALVLITALIVCLRDRRCPPDDACTAQPLSDPNAPPNAQLQDKGLRKDRGSRRAQERSGKKLRDQCSRRGHGRRWGSRRK